MLFPQNGEMKKKLAKEEIIRLLSFLMLPPWNELLWYVPERDEEQGDVYFYHLPTTTPWGVADKSKGKLPARVVRHQDMSPTGAGAPPALQRSQNWMPKALFIYLIFCWWVRKQQLLQTLFLGFLSCAGVTSPHNQPKDHTAHSLGF